MGPAYSYPLLIGQLLRSTLQTAAHQRITYADLAEFSYAEFAERVARLGAVLTRLGLGQGAVVAMMDFDSNRYLESFFAVPMVGATLHTVNVRLSPEQILYTINHAEDDAILVNAEFLALLTPLLPRITRKVQLILLSDTKGAVVPAGFVGEYEALLAGADPGFVFAEFDENTRATLFYTTGTTGDPKGVSYSHRQLVLHTLGALIGNGSVPGQAGLLRGDVYMPLTPLFHVHGWGIPYAATLLGLHQVYPGRYEPAKLLGLIANHGVTFSHCVPTILSMLLNAPESASVDLSRWKVIIGGAALSEGLARAATARGIDVYAGYGMSETCPLLTLADMHAAQGPGDTTAIRTATGKPVPLVQLRIVDPQMRDVARDGVSTGEIVARAPWLTQEYLKNAAGTAALWEGGWLHTGDVGTMASDGTVRITDRLKDVIKSGGEWISSLALESIVSTVPGVLEVAAVAVPDARWGERPVLVLATGSGDPSSVGLAAQSAVDVAIAKGELSKWAAPERVVFVGSLPKTSVGKIDKKVIRAGLASGELR